MALFCNLADIVANRECVSEKREREKWQAMEYSTKLGEGRLLLAVESICPKPVHLNLNLTGWHKIYIGHFCLAGTNSSYVKLSGDEYYTPIRYITAGSPHNWQPIEFMQEIYWKCADLTDQQFILSKPELNSLSVSGIAWIRCEEMSEEEVARYRSSLDKKNKCIQMHFDIDSFYEDRSEDKIEHPSKLSLFENTNTDFCFLEYSMLFEESEPQPDNIGLRTAQMPLNTGKYTLEEIYEQYIRLGREKGIKLYAGERMSVASFHEPHALPDFIQKFVTDHSQYYLHNRDDSTVSICSYAYPEVQEYVLKRMVKMVKMGFEGVTMIYHRGVHIGFEAPVIERFKERYPNLDPHLLPVSDKRLHGIWCEFMTEFMRRARKTLDNISGKRVPINVIVNYGLESTKNFGLDVAQWAKEGLIDSVSHANMEIYEDLTGCMSEEDETLIDMEKYKKRNEDVQILKRNYCSDVEKICRYMPEFLELEKEYGVTVYHTLPWPHEVTPEKYPEVIEQMKACGAKKFLCWNGNHMTWDRALFHQITNTGNETVVEVIPRKFYKTRTIDHHDISQFFANWRG